MELKELLESQREFNINLKSDLTEDEIINNLTLALNVEVGEFANELAKFKYWKKHKEFSREKTIMEFVDIILIWSSLAVCLGYEAEELEEKIKFKIQVNKDRQDNDY